MISIDLLTLIAIGFVVLTVCITSLALTWEIMQNDN